MNTIKVVADSMYPYDKLIPIPKGQVEFSKIRFVFSEGWDGKNKIAQFEQGESLLNQEIIDGVCTVPAELEIGSCMLYVKGYDTEGTAQIATANGVVLLVVPGAKNGGNPPVPPDPDLYAQLLTKVDEAVLKVAPLIKDNHWWVWSTTEEAYVDSGIEVGQPQVQADWEQSNPNLESYVQNRTHYVIPIKDSIIVSYNWTGNGGAYSDTFSDSAELGVYKLSQKPQFLTVENLFGATYAGIKFGEVVKSEMGPGFLFMFTVEQVGPSDHKICIYSTAAALYSQKPTIKDLVSVSTLPDMYIPDTIARKSDVPTEADITALINNALGVIEDGAY